MKNFLGYVGFGLMILLLVLADSKYDHDAVDLKMCQLELEQMKEGKLVREGMRAVPTPTPTVEK